ncbi:hypothetical protein SLS60_008741 [Paraconiothyrium brasiliense]|uniref:F-box domain-containing protein n=1 Tax=Paraconiothyrium brasiliense TaxID=300254 RepID=A0ABR3QYB6_9PLEO
MELLSLPPELIHGILLFIDWDDILSFISTTKYITDHILSKSDISRLRRNCCDRLLFWETERRIERGWPPEPNVKRGAWFEHAQLYGQRMYLWHVSQDERLAEIPCYKCLRFRNLEMFTSSMRCGGQMVGQTLATRRVCIPCGVKIGFYYGGLRLRIMSPWNGARNDPDTLEELSGTLPAQYDASADDDYGRQPRISLDEYWWWTYSHMCALCAAEAGYTMEQVLDSEPRKDTFRAKMKERNRRSMLASLEERQDRGRKIRASLGIPEPCNLLDIESMKLEDDPFPNFQPVPIFQYMGSEPDEESKAEILNHMNGETSAAEIQEDIDKRRKTTHPSLFKGMSMNN